MIVTSCVLYMLAHCTLYNSEKVINNFALSTKLTKHVKFHGVDISSTTCRFCITAKTKNYILNLVQLLAKLKSLLAYVLNLILQLNGFLNKKLQYYLVIGQI